MLIHRTWFMCHDKGCTWYDDADNCFGECPECGSTNLCVLETEVIDFNTGLLK